jgi:transcriptional regulator with XRE-family HTH domain
MFTYVDTPVMFTYVDTMDHLNARTVALLGKGVRQLRGSRGLKQAELAERAGVSRTWLSQLESGTQRNAELASVLSVLEVLGARLTLTLDEDPQP